MLENYEKDTNDRMQKTIDAIGKKKDELEIIGKELQSIRQAKKYVQDEMAGGEAEPVSDASEEPAGEPESDFPEDGEEQPAS